ncbi:hypothetical protein JXA12_03610 [Candidatus Woesearchaeota archaeon]|nr:hypothetical protein [Candidatus Woesearchaeota archaeon]
MRETLERLSWEDDFSRLREGLKHFHERNKGLLHLLRDDATKLTMDVMNAVKALETVGPGNAEEKKREIQRYLKNAVKLLKDAENTADHLLGERLKVS